MTDGPRPCSIFHGDRVEEVPAELSSGVVDATAAGDAFNAGYLSGRLRGVDPAIAGHRLAVRVAGHRGAIVFEGGSDWSETD